MSEAEPRQTYTLFYTTPNDPYPQTPYHEDYADMAEALREAWINHLGGGVSLRIMLGQDVILEHEALRELFSRMTGLEKDEPNLDGLIYAERALRETGR